MKSIEVRVKAQPAGTTNKISATVKLQYGTNESDTSVSRRRREIENGIVNVFRNMGYDYSEISIEK